MLDEKDKINREALNSLPVYSEEDPMSERACATAMIASDGLELRTGWVSGLLDKDGSKYLIYSDSSVGTDSEYMFDLNREKILLIPFEELIVYQEKPGRFPTTSLELLAMLSGS